MSENIAKRHHESVVINTHAIALQTTPVAALVTAIFCAIGKQSSQSRSLAECRPLFWMKIAWDFPTN